MCSDVVESQLQESRTMRQRLCDWYGICRPNFGGLEPHSCPFDDDSF
jgi:hypothetical protein